MALLAAVVDAVLGVQTEIAIFLIALIVHTLLFGTYRFKPRQQKSKQVSGLKESPKAVPSGSKGCAAKPAFVPGADALTRSAKQLLRQGATRSTFVEELGAQVQASHAKEVCPALATMLEGVGRNASAELVGAVRDILHEQELAPNDGLAELMLKSLLTLRLQSEFQEVLAEAEAADGATPAIAVLALRSSLSASDLDTSMDYIRRFATPLKASIGSTASSSPQQLIQQLLQLGIQQNSVRALVSELAECGFLSSWVFEVAVKECTSKGAKNAPLLRELEELARKHGLELTDAACGALLRGAASAKDALHIFTEAAERGAVGKDVLLAAIEASVTHRSTSLTEVVLKHLPKNPSADVATALLRSIVDGPLRGKDADTMLLSTYEQHLGNVDVLTDTRTGRLVAEAALRRKRQEALEQLMRSATEQPRQVGLLKGFAAEHRLADATAIFQACPEKTGCLYNALLDAAIDSKDMEAAERIMAEAVAADMADVVTYNTIIKKHLQNGQFERARAVIETMRSAGGNFAPNSVTFNELIDATIKTRSEGVWVLLEEMKACGLQPTGITCSILLKSIQRSSNTAEVERIMTFVGELDDCMDEVLLSSICEACIRAGRSDLLANQLKRQRSSRGIQINGAHTFGSVIRGYGFLNDLEGAWEAWTEMRSRKIVPTSITIGCMVEALVSNGDPEAGFNLIHELAADEKARPLLNAVVYCSVVKGFTHQKSYDRVWVVYEEMIKSKLQFSIVTYNALIDTCARGGTMVRVQPLLQDMSRDKIEPNLVTYSTIVKGYCQEGRLDKAFELLEAMKKSRHFRPDEITYNTLIDGCAQRGMYDQGMKLLEEMQETGVAPSNFTLSVVVKLANRGKRPERAFEIVEELSRKYYLQLNVHVYDNLVHACTNHGDMRRAFQVLERMARQRVRPDVRTYTLLLRACMEAGEFQEAAGLVRMACGVRGAQMPPRLGALASGPAAHLLQLNRGLPTDLLTELLEAMAGRGGEERLAVQLCKELRSAPGVRLDPKLSMSLTSRAIRGPGF
mmetsp:Transcript_23455/g.66957  ORF Transcript_23455/g.66957 Transcript_23455/m.66957 type:complete len:1029 (-) Transcript_23455:41-3127(-)